MMLRDSVEDPIESTFSPDYFWENVGTEIGPNFSGELSKDSETWPQQNIEEDGTADGKPGQKWYKNFLKRHPEISLREAKTVNRARAIITEQYIRTWFRDLKEYLETNKINDIMINPARVFNGDESGFSLCPKSGKVLAPKGCQEKDNITTLVVFSADGEVAPPLVVFPYVRPPKAVVENMPPKWVLDGYDMKNHIINGFRKCGLFPLDPENVDFTKCVQNIIEQQNELNVETNDPLTSEEIRAAEKVILRLRNKLIPKGVNVDLIFDEIKILENEASRQIVIEKLDQTFLINFQKTPKHGLTII
ncbi:hypothetical protein JTB14_025143 [Gonioctena quinquepunctata]|nr:hypothetical protein JTB14_025143 [Gonioctena quinquepunctata]